MLASPSVCGTLFVFPPLLNRFGIELHSTTTHQNRALSGIDVVVVGKEEEKERDNNNNELRPPPPPPFPIYKMGFFFFSSPFHSEKRKVPLHPLLSCCCLPHRWKEEEDGFPPPFQSVGGVAFCGQTMGFCQRRDERGGGFLFSPSGAILRQVSARDTLLLRNTLSFLSPPLGWSRKITLEEISKKVLPPFTLPTTSSLFIPHAGKHLK